MTNSKLWKQYYGNLCNISKRKECQRSGGVVRAMEGGVGSGEGHEGDGEVSRCADEQMMRGLLGKRKRRRV